MIGFSSSKSLFQIHSIAQKLNAIAHMYEIGKWEEHI